MHRYSVFVLSIACILAGCSTQLTNVTTAGASAVEPIFRQVTLDNFSKLLDQPSALPSQIAIAAGTMATSNQISPSVSFPLSHSATVTTAGGGSQSTTIGAGGATIAAQIAFNLNYQVTPITDSLQLRNLRAQYMAVLCQTLKSDTAWFEGKCGDYNLRSEFMPPRMADSNDELKLDPYYLKRPNCVLCQEPKVTSLCPIPIEDRATLDPATPFTEPWLYWEPAGLLKQTSPTSPPRADVKLVSIGQAGGREFFATSEEKFANFLLTLLPVSASPSRPQSEASICKPKPGEKLLERIIQPPLPGSTEGPRVPQLQFVVPLQ